MGGVCHEGTGVDGIGDLVPVRIGKARIGARVRSGGVLEAVVHAVAVAVDLRGVGAKPPLEGIHETVAVVVEVSNAASLSFALEALLDLGALAAEVARRLAAELVLGSDSKPAPLELPLHLGLLDATGSAFHYRSPGAQRIGEVLRPERGTLLEKGLGDRQSKPVIALPVAPPETRSLETVFVEPDLALLRLALRAPITRLRDQWADEDELLPRCQLAGHNEARLRVESRRQTCRDNQ